MSDLNEQERQLIAELESLAAAIPREAPARVRTRLSAEFRRRKSRWKMPMAVAAAVAIGVLSMTNVEWRRPVTLPAQSFVMLDNLEINTGIVMRMKLPSAVFGGPAEGPEVEADVLVGEDGLAHGFRLVK